MGILLIFMFEIEMLAQSFRCFLRFAVDQFPVDFAGVFAMLGAHLVKENDVVNLLADVGVLHAALDISCVPSYCNQ